MWFKEVGDSVGVLPYYLLICLPILIILSPINPVRAGPDLEVHRFAHYELAGNTLGSKQVSEKSEMTTNKSY